MSEEYISLAVTCQSCATVVWQGNDLVVEDGAELLEAYAPVMCTRGDCPHKPAPTPVP